MPGRKGTPCPTRAPSPTLPSGPLTPLVGPHRRITAKRAEEQHSTVPTGGSTQVVELATTCVSQSPVEVARALEGSTVHTVD